MKHLAFIPSKQDKAEIKSLFHQPTPEPAQTIDRHQEETPSVKQLTKTQLNALLSRLTRITKKQYDIQQQSAHIAHVNKELQQKRLLGQKVENRLLAKGKERENKITQMGEQLEKQKRAAFYRQIPEISEIGHKVVQPGIDKRLQQLIQTRQSRKEALRNKYQPSFQPMIDPHSDFINDVENLGDLFNRMNAKEREASKRKESIVKKLEEEQKEDLTFKPKINPKSVEIASHLPLREIPGTPFERHSPSKQNYETFPFAPTINKNTSKLLENCKRNEDCFRRLYDQAKQLTIKNESKVKQRQRAVSFQPSLNKKSLKLASSQRQGQNLPKSRRSRTSMPDETASIFEEVRVGSEADFERNRTCELRGSKMSRCTWVEESQNIDSDDVKESILKRLRMMK